MNKRTSPNHLSATLSSGQSTGTTDISGPKRSTPELIFNPNTTPPNNGGLRVYAANAVGLLFVDLCDGLDEALGTFVYAHAAPMV